MRVVLGMVSLFEPREEPQQEPKWVRRLERQLQAYLQGCLRMGQEQELLQAWAQKRGLQIHWGALQEPMPLFVVEIQKHRIPVVRMDL